MANCSKQGVIITGCYGECTPDVFLLIELICAHWHGRAGWNNRQPLFYQQGEASEGSNGGVTEDMRAAHTKANERCASAALVPR